MNNARKATSAKPVKNQYSPKSGIKSSEPLLIGSPHMGPGAKPSEVGHIPRSQTTVEYNSEKTGQNTQ